MKHGPSIFLSVLFRVLLTVWFFNGTQATSPEEHPSAIDSLWWADYSGLSDGTAGMPMTEPGWLLGEVLAEEKPQPQLRQRAGSKKDPVLLAADLRPEATLKEKPFSLTTWGFLSSTIMFFGFLCVCFCLSCAASAVTDRVQHHIEHFDENELGVPVSLERLESNAITGRLEATGLVVGNPRGKGYASDVLLRVATVSVDLDLVELNLTAFRTINVESLQVSGVDVNFETRGQTSNIEDVLTHLRRRQVTPGSQPRNVCLQRVSINDIGALACPPSVRAARVTVLRAVREDGSASTPADSFVEFRYGVQGFRTNTRRSEGNACTFNQTLTPFPLIAGEPLVCSFKRVEQPQCGVDGNVTPMFEEVGETAPVSLESLDLGRAPGGANAWEEELDLWKVGALTGVLTGSQSGNLRAGRIFLRVEMVGVQDRGALPAKRVGLGDLHFTDFDREIGQSTARGAAAELLRTVLETVLQNMSSGRLARIGPEPRSFLVPSLSPQPSQQPSPEQAPLRFLVPSLTAEPLSVAHPARTLEVVAAAPSPSAFPVIVTSPMLMAPHPSPVLFTPRPISEAVTLSPMAPMFTVPPPSPTPSPIPSPVPASPVPASPPRTEAGSSGDPPGHASHMPPPPVRDANAKQGDDALEYTFDTPASQPAAVDKYALRSSSKETPAEDDVWVEVGVPSEVFQVVDADGKPHAAG